MNEGVICLSGCLSSQVVACKGYKIYSDIRFNFLSPLTHALTWGCRTLRGGGFCLGLETDKHSLLCLDGCLGIWGVVRSYSKSSKLCLPPKNHYY